MSPEELIDGFLADELSDAEQAELDALLVSRPDLLRQLVEQRAMDNALDVLHGDGTADQQVTVSVLGVLRAKPDDAFKTDLLKKVQADAAQKRRQDEALRIPTPPPIDAVRVDRPAVRRAPLRRGRLVAVAGLAAAALIAVGALFFRPAAPVAPAGDSAFLISAGANLVVLRGAQSIPGRLDLVLKPGDRLTVPDGSQAALGFADDPTRLDLPGPAELVFVRGGADKRVELLRGELTAAVPHQDRPFSAAAPHGEVRASEAEFRFQSAPAFARLEVQKGSATLARADGRTVKVGPEHFAVAGRDLDLIARAVGSDGPASGGPAPVAVLRELKGDVWLFTRSPADRAPAKPGQGVLDGQSLLLEGARSRAVLEYPDRTRIEAAGDTLLRRFTDEKDPQRKDLRLEKGQLTADVTKQPAGKPMTVRSAAATVTVVGTRFVLEAERDEARLLVEEGAVRFQRAADRKEIEVRSGFQARVAPGTPFEPAPAPGGARFLEIDLSAGTNDGDGDWESDGRVVRQRRVPRDSFAGSATRLFKAECDEGVVLEAVTEVDRVASDAAPGTWGFGLAAVFRDRRVVLRSQQGGDAGSIFEFKDVKSIPFEHGREGTYRLKLRLERRADSARATLRGKIWQGDREPDGWMIEDDLILEGPLTHVGFQTVRCAASFGAFKVRVLKEESR
jgi:ferric-dicitrate binding protein FerR (iron transport regulator)